MRSSSSSSFSVQSSTLPITIPRSASCGASSRAHSFDCCDVKSTARPRISPSVSCGVRPSGERTEIPDASCPIRPATRSMKNSSTIIDEMARNLTRSRSGTASSAPISSTREHTSTKESSRFRSLSRGSVGAISATLLRCGLGDRIKLVADSEPGLDEGVIDGPLVDLLAQLADADVDGAVAMCLAPAPYLLEELIASDNTALLETEGVQEAKL